MRVTIGELVEDFIPHTEKGNKITQVEIVPRKIVEDIIKVCEEGKRLEEKNLMFVDNPNIKNLYYAKAVTYESVAIFAERLLNAFEKEGE